MSETNESGSVGQVRLKLVNAGNIDGRAYLNKQDLEKHNIEEFDYIRIQNEYSDWAGAQCLASDEVDSGFIAVDGSILESSNLSDGDEVVLEKAEAQGLNAVKLGIEPMAGQEVESTITYIANNFDKLGELLRNRVVYSGLAINWPEAEIGHLKVRYLESDPVLETSELGIIDPLGREVKLDVVPFTEMAFNAILVLDVSGSMTKKDMKVRNISGALEGLKKGIEMTPDLESFLSQFEEGAKVSRVNAAAMAIMLFLSLKISKGWGEQVQVVTFSSDVEAFSLNDSQVIECVGEAKKAGIEGIIRHVVEKSQGSSGLTFLSGALNTAFDSIEQFRENPVIKDRNPTMIVVLTDGAPNKGGDSPDLPVNPVPVLKRKIESYTNVVTYFIGLGEADRLMLKKLGEIGRGGSLMADDLESLTK
ncbi:MAG TPA: VWA domain-containing protein, partial [Candidatus Hodarchaeales archaeon]|nr:VWA domain-containing protein [Candidatus Hodarchaeales archaeon]